MAERGRNSGITGLVDVAGAPPFWARVYRFGQGLNAAPIVRTGRGDEWRKVRQTAPGGTLALSGKIQLAGYPLPASLKGAGGTVRLQYHENASSTLSVIVTAASLSFDERSQDTWDVQLTCEVIRAPTLAGFTGSQSIFTPAPSYNRVVTHEGIGKTVDPDGLQDGDQLRLDLEGIGDDDASEVAKVVDIIAFYVSNSTRAGMKVRSASFSRTDPWGGVVVVAFGKTTSGEDVVNAATATTLDPRGLGNQATAAAINGTPTDPGAGYVFRTSTTRELNDAHALRTDQFGTRDTVDDVEMPGTSARLDPLAVESSGRDTAVYTTAGGVPAAPAAPSAELQVVARTTQELDQARSQAVTDFDVLTSHQKREYPETQTVVDPRDLSSRVKVSDVFPNVAAPAAPATPSGMRYVDYLDVPVTPTQSLRVWRFAKNDSADEAILPHSWTSEDPEDLESEGEVAAIDADFAVPTGYVKRSKLGKYLTPDHVLNINRFGLRSTRDDIEYAETLGEAIAFEGFSQQVGEVIDSTATAAALAATYFNTYQANVNFRFVRARRINRRKALVVVGTADNNILITFNMLLVWRSPVVARLDAGEIKVFLRRKLKVGTNQWHYEIGEQDWPAAVMEVQIARRVAGNQLPMHWDLLYTCNSNDFLGLTAKCVAYKGNNGRVNYSNATPSENAFQLEYDSRGQFDLKECTPGWHWTSTKDLSALTVGTWVKASDVGFTSASLTGANYGSLLA